METTTAFPHRPETTLKAAREEADIPLENLRGAALVLNAAARSEYADKEMFLFISDGIFEQVKEIRAILGLDQEEAGS